MHIEQIPAYLTWKIRHKALYPDAEFGKAILPDDEEGMHLGLFDENQLRAVVSLFRTNDSIQFRKFATLPDFQNKGYGSALLDYVLNIVKDENCRRLWCKARQTASDFYKKFGFHETEIRSNFMGIEYVVMERSFVDKW